MQMGSIRNAWGKGLVTRLDFFCDICSVSLYQYL